VRSEAVMALGEMGPAARTAIPALLATLEDDELRLLEPLVAVTLGNVGESAVPALQKALAGKKVPQKRAAAFALAQIGPKAADAVPALTETLNDGEAEVRALAAKALGKVGPAAKGSVPKLEAALQDREVRVRVGAALALLQAGGGAGGLKALTEALKDGSPFVRVEAYRALGEFGAKGSSAVLRVMDGLRDDNARVRSAAADAARRIPAKNDVDKLTVVTGLLRCLTDEDEDVRLSAAGALWPLTPADTHVKLTKTVAAALESQSPSARKRAATILAEFGREARAAVPALVTALRDLDPGVREAVADALKKIDPAAAAKAGLR
jgi:HEAT repeat protein